MRLVLGANQLYEEQTIAWCPEFDWSCDEAEKVYKKRCLGRNNLKIALIN
jgi:hypothetical protein